jgi:hypothetical protein
MSGRRFFVAHYLVGIGSHNYEMKPAADWLEVEGDGTAVRTVMRKILIVC